jgi:hypothetical protein
MLRSQWKTVTVEAVIPDIYSGVLAQEQKKSGK